MWRFAALVHRKHAYRMKHNGAKLQDIFWFLILVLRFFLFERVTENYLKLGLCHLCVAQGLFLPKINRCKMFFHIFNAQTVVLPKIWCQIMRHIMMYQNYTCLFWKSASRYFRLIVYQAVIKSSHRQLMDISDFRAI